MKTRVLLFAASVALWIGLAGCASIGIKADIYNVQDKPIPASAQSEGIGLIAAHIDQAASAKGWRIDKIKPGELRAMQDWDSQAAVVTILFTQTSYSLLYHSSSNMKGSDGRIMSQYNFRVRALETEIDRRLRTPATPL